MTDFVLEQTKSFEATSKLDYLETKYNELFRIEEYARLLKTPLNLGMFVPCDQEGNIINERPEPKILAKGVFNYTAQNIWDEKYNKAKDIVLFKGFELVTDMYKSCKRFIIWMPDNVNQVYRNVLYPNGKNDKFFFNHYKEFTTVEDLVKFNLELKSKKALAKK